MPRAGKNIDFTGCTGNPGFNPSLTIAIFGSLTMLSGMGQGGSGFQFYGRGSHTITSPSGQMGGSVEILSFGGTYQLVNNLATGANFQHTNGTLDMNGRSVTCATFLTNNTNTRSIINATGTLTLTSAPTIWSINTTGLTFDAFWTGYSY
jgi:hypothetical protein